MILRRPNIYKYYIAYRLAADQFMERDKERESIEPEQDSEAENQR